jgi:predicted DNA-binding protein
MMQGGGGMKLNTKKVVVSIPPALYDALEKLAEEKHRTVSGYIRWLIWRHVEEKDIAISLFSKGKA